MFSKHIIYIFICLVIHNLVYTQQPDLQLKHLTPNDGLTQGVVTNIFTDSKGFVWMTGLDGINRFDGIKCLANDKIAKGLSQPGKTYGIVEDNNGNLWFGYDKGIIKYSYRNNMFEMIRFSESLREAVLEKSGFYTPGFCDRENNLFVGLNSNDAVIYNTISRKIAVFNNPARLRTETYVLKRKGLAGTADDLIVVQQYYDSCYIYESKNWNNQKPGWKQSSIYSSKHILSVTLFDENNLLFFDDDFLWKYNLQTRQLQHSEKISIYLPGITVDNKKGIWVGSSGNGLFLFDPHSLQLIGHYLYEPENKNSISGNSIYPTIVKDDHLWLASWGNGVDYCNLADTKFQTHLSKTEVNYNKTNNFIRGIAETKDGNFYCNTQFGGIIELNNKLEYIRTLPGLLSKLASPDILLDGNYLYVTDDYAAKHGLIKYDLVNQSYKEIFFQGTGSYSANPAPYRFSKMADGNLLVATYSGLWKFNTHNDKLEILSAITNINELVVFTWQDRKNRIYKGPELAECVECRSRVKRLEIGRAHV